MPSASIQSVQSLCYELDNLQLAGKGNNFLFIKFRLDLEPLVLRSHWSMKVTTLISV